MGHQARLLLDPGGLAARGPMESTPSVPSAWAAEEVPENGHDERADHHSNATVQVSK